MREFIYAKRFDKSFDKLGLTDDDLIRIENIIIDNPSAGDVIEGTGGLRKVRYALPHQGKSSGTRVLYVDFAYYEIVYMIDIYIKKEKDNLSDNEKTEIKKVLKVIENNLRSGSYE